MNHDKLDQLLRDADAADASPAIDASLAGRVRARAKRQRRIRGMGAGVIATAAVVVFGWAMWPDVPRSPAPRFVQSTQPLVPITSVADLRAELTALSSEADRLTAEAEALWAAERPAYRAPRRAAIGVDVQVERAAFTMVYQAARMPASSAADVYRQVSQVFPDTPSAQVARQRLSELRNRKEG